MTYDLPLEQMTVAEKLTAIESIWESLRAAPTDLTSPAWHEKVLEDRAERLKSGTATVSDWGSSKKRLQDLGQ